MGTVLLHLRKQVFPSMTRLREVPLLYHPAEVRIAIFNRLNAAIASGIEHQLRGARQLSGLRARQAEIHLEADPSVRIFRSRVAAQIMLAGREKDRWSFIGAAVVESSLPGIACRANQRLHAATALHADSRGNGFGNKRSIKRLARKRGRGKRQWSLRCAPPSGQTNIVDRYGAKRCYVDPKRVQV